MYPHHNEEMKVSLSVYSETHGTTEKSLFTHVRNKAFGNKHIVSIRPLFNSKANHIKIASKQLY